MKDTKTIVTKEDIIVALKELGLKSTDIVITHSSLKSFGNVDGGADAVIDALKSVLYNGTVVFPTLRQRNFYNAYKDWNVKTTPSDVGYITEKFRLSKGVFRSNQATHSVCAYGKDAEFLTKNHGGGEKRIGIFGDTPFSSKSPWQKMYDMGAKVVMIGVTMLYNTFKHFVEYKLINDMILNIKDENVKNKAISKISKFSDIEKFYLDGAVEPRPSGVWFSHDTEKAQSEMENLGKVRKVKCGESTIIAFNVKDYVDFQYNAILSNPAKWLKNDDAIKWFKEYNTL